MCIIFFSILILLFPFFLSSAQQFISIDGGVNGTYIYDSTPTINWTLTSDTSKYWLQIANDSAFTDVVVNITDINLYMYPSDYTENITVASFNLPSEHALSYGTYYMRIKSCIKD